MLVYRITLAKYANALVASGNEGRWNTRGAKVIYSASSRSLACLENLVHRSGIGPEYLFKTMIIEIPGTIPVTTIDIKQLPDNWNTLFSLNLTRNMGELWYRERNTLLLKVPSAIIPAEHNIIINTQHPFFSKVKLVRTEPFLFDQRLPHA
jgi:RES domain-containing protein